MPATPNKKAPEGAADDKVAAAFSGGDIGIHLIVCVLVGCGLGYAFDQWLGLAPLGLLVGMALGFGAWLTAIWRLMNSRNKERGTR